MNILMAGGVKMSGSIVTICYQWKERREAYVMFIAPPYIHSKTIEG